MRRILGALLLPLLFAGAAGAVTIPPPPPLLSVAADGTAAALIDGSQLALGGTLGFATASATGAAPRDDYYGVWVVAAPDDSARVLWVAPLSDYERPDPPNGVALMATGPRGTRQVSPILPDTADTSFDVGADPEGDVVAAWSGGSERGAAAAGPSTTFSAVSGTVPAAPSVAVAAGGGALIAGRDCATCALTVRERPAGGTFGDDAQVPGTEGVERYRAALASDATALLAGSRGAHVVAFERPSGTWSGAIGLGDELQGATVAPAVGVGRGGVGVVSFRNAQGADEVHELPGDGTPGRVTTYPMAGFIRRQSLAVTDSGAAAAITASGLIQRSAGQSFGPPTPSDASAVALGPAGPLLGTEFIRTFDVTYGGIRTAVAPLPPLPPGSGVLVLPKPERVRVPTGPVRTAGRIALVPLVCGGADRRCRGTVGTQAFDLSSGGGRFVAVPAGPHVARVHFAVHQDKSTRRFTRRIAGGPDRRACQLRPWARVLARSGPYRLATESRELQPDILACGPGAPRRVVGAGAPEAADIRGARFAYVADNKLTTFSLGLGHATRHRLFTGYARSVRSLRLADDGAVALVDRVDERVRVRVVQGDADRVLDAGPGVDPRSLAVDGNTVSWTRDGTTRSATV